MRIFNLYSHPVYAGVFQEPKPRSMWSRTLEEQADNLFLVYDGDCPFCSNYVRYVRVQKALGRLQLINAREGGRLVDSIRERGIDLNEGMVLILDDRYYFGAECMYRLALMSTGSGLFNAVNAMIFSRPILSRLLYPCLKFGRRITLLLLGRSRLE